MNKLQQISLGILAGCILCSLHFFMYFKPQKLSSKNLIEMVSIPKGKTKIYIPITINFQNPTYIEKEVIIDNNIKIGKYQVTVKQWALCVNDGYCKAKKKASKNPKHPITHVSWLDAQQFTKWLSDKTGDSYRLPTEGEWLYSKYLGIQTKPASKETYPTTNKLQNHGYFGSNKWNIYDQNSNINEWTLSCWHASKALNLQHKSIEKLKQSRTCNMRITQGLNRVHLPHFVNTPASGGCTTNIVPDYLGFRVVQDNITSTTSIP